jgi:mRNA interferase MazF
MTKGKVVLVPFPFDDLSTIKVRPAVCLTEPIGPHQHVILAFITSRIPAPILDTDLVLDANHADFASTGLLVSSTLQLQRLMTATTSLINRAVHAGSRTSNSLLTPWNIPHDKYLEIISSHPVPQRHQGGLRLG